MSKQTIKPSLAKGMRDFSAQEIYAREHIFDTIRKVYRKYGFGPLETPVVENLSVLTGKYGEDGDKLLFKIINSGEYLKDVADESLNQKDYKKITPNISEKGLRYDLTVPLARYVAMNRNELVFPFKRYQIDKVWRADRPQKGRYREFYQCDADVIGSYSLIYDAECILMFDEVLSSLDMPEFYIKINNRKILAGLAEAWDFSDKFNEFAIAIDKLDKIGEDGVIRELGNRGFSETQIHQMQDLFRLQGTIDEKLNTLEIWFAKSPTGQKGVSELREVLNYLKDIDFKKGEIELDLKLARGLDYYTSTIFEVVLKEVQMGSIASGGRYDDLTASFGVPDMPGVGISFGAERIYDVMRDLDLLPKHNISPVKVLLANFGKEEESHSFKTLYELRKEGIAAEIYPLATKLNKQFTYAEKKGITFMLMLGSEEIKEHIFPLKNIETGEQQKLSWPQLIEVLKN
ncbi:MAG: histidine--tRNA ligase [Bacteroidia bacterium]